MAKKYNFEINKNNYRAEIRIKDFPLRLTSQVYENLIFKVIFVNVLQETTC